MRTSHLILLAAAKIAHAHTAAFANGMYCRNGTDPNSENPNTNDVVNPLYNLPKSEWWMQHDRGCDQIPPEGHHSLELPAGGEFTVELAHNRAHTTLSYGGEYATDWPDGGEHPEDWHGPEGGCLVDNADGAGGAMHAKDFSTTAGTAFAISYHADISEVTMENLAVFTVLEHTPWKRLATYQVPKDLPPCPAGGCYCAWLWVPDGCGQPNMYMQNFKCHVTGSTSTKKVAEAKPPVYCADDQSKCVRGAKQMIVMNQAEGNNVETPGVSPAYSTMLGWASGAQDDIFEEGSTPVEPVEEEPVEEEPVEEEPAEEEPVEEEPVEEPEQPTEEPEQPTEEPEQPTEEPEQPTEEPVEEPSTCPARRYRRRSGRKIRSMQKH